MLEMMVASNKSSSSVPTQQPTSGYNFSSGESTGSTPISIASLSGNFITPVAPLSPYTQVLNLSNKAYACTPLTAFQPGTGDFTLEFAFYLTTTTPGYGGLILSNAASNGPGIQVFFGDAGLSNRLLVTLQGNTNGTYFCTNKTRAVLVNKWTHVAVQRRSGYVMMYVDGVKQSLAVYSSLNYSATEILSTQNINALTLWNLGSTTAPGNSHIAEFAFYNGVVKYTADFTPSYPFY